LGAERFFDALVSAGDRRAALASDARFPRLTRGRTFFFVEKRK